MSTTGRHADPPGTHPCVTPVVRALPSGADAARAGVWPVRAVASERVSNLRVLSPRMTAQDERAWAEFFRVARRLSAEFTIVAFQAGATTATAQVRAQYHYVEAANGPPQELRQRLAMRFAKTSVGWRISGMDEVR